MSWGSNPSFSIFREKALINGDMKGNAGKKVNLEMKLDIRTEIA
jgi:hypothetical protein